jgi:2-dehydropantoate 2-reductase
VKIAIVGTGAVGGYYGAKLVHLGYDVHFLFRRDLDVVRKQGLQIQSKDGNFTLTQVQAYGSTSEIGPCDLVIVALKASSNNSLKDLIPPLLHSTTAILTLQNGLWNDEFLAEEFGKERIMGGLCFVCLNRIAPGVIHHFGYGKIAFGEFGRKPQERTREIAEMFKRSGVDCEVVENLLEARWKKLMWNIPFNGLTIAAGGIDVAQVLANPILFERTRKLMREIIDAAAKFGFSIPLEFIEMQIEGTRKMGAYLPSSLIDYKEGRMIELEPIWGEPLRRAKGVGADVPELEALYLKLKELTAQHVV